MKLKLTDIEVEKIEFYLRANGIRDEELFSEIIDHLCILTESELENTPNFNDAFAVALKKFNKKELMDIVRNKESFYLHPEFLNKTFLIVFGILSVSAFCIGIYLKMNLLPGRKLFLVGGGILTGYIYLPMLLLYWLTEFANKLKYVLLFISLFAAFHSFIGLVLKWPVTKWFITGAAIFSILFVILFLIKPNFKNKA